MPPHAAATAIDGGAAIVERRDVASRSRVRGAPITASPAAVIEAGRVAVEQRDPRAGLGEAPSAERPRCRPPRP